MSSPGPSKRPSRTAQKRIYKEESSIEPEESPRAQKPPAAKRAKVKKEEGDGIAKKPRRIKKTISPEEAAKKAREKGWKEWVTANQWVQDRKYKHQDQPFVYNKGDAQKFVADHLEPKLTDREFNTLPFQLRPSQFEGYKASHMYSVADIYALVQRKGEALGLPITLPPPSPFDNWWNPKDPPLIDHEYTSPENTDDPPPEHIIWHGRPIRHRNILLKDACILYCVEEQQLEDLVKHSKWLDAKTVAIRAVQLHGGVKRHNEIVTARRSAAEKYIEDKQRAAGTPYSTDGQPSERYSDYLEEQIDLKRQSNDPASFHLPWYDRSEYVEVKEVKEWDRGQRQVKQFAPLLKLYRLPGQPFDYDLYTHGTGYCGNTRKVTYGP